MRPRPSPAKMPRRKRNTGAAKTPTVSTDDHAPRHKPPPSVDPTPEIQAAGGSPARADAQSTEEDSVVVQSPKRAAKKKRRKAGAKATVGAPAAQSAAAAADRRPLTLPAVDRGLQSFTCNCLETRGVTANGMRVCKHCGFMPVWLQDHGTVCGKNDQFCAS